MTDAPVLNADVATAAPSLVSRLIAEAFGTLVLVGAVIGTAIFTSAGTGPVGPALAAGIAVLGSAYAVGHISGGHFNPAVTLGAAAAGRFAWADVLPYIVAQVIGGALATTILFAIKAGIPEGAVGDFAGASNGWGEHSGVGANLLSVILIEVVFTAIFLWVILGVTDRRAPTGFAPLAIGLTLTAIHLVAIPVSNASFNPARSIATAIYGGPDALIQLWVFLVAPLVGALIAGASYKVLFDRK